MSIESSSLPGTRGRDPQMTVARVALILGLVLWAATFFLISPQPGKTYPGAIPWRDLSLLRPLTELMSLNGLVATARGVEIKDFVLHLAAAAGLALLGVRQIVAADHDRRPRSAVVAGYAQVFLAGWVLLSLLSSLWSGAPDLARGQALLYALHLGWAVALAHTFDRRDLPSFTYGVIGISALGAGLAIWYYYERNPHHRAGFPIGNPTVLAAVLLPAILMSLSVLAAAIGRLRVGTASRRGAVGTAAFAVAAQVLLLYCFWLTRSRGATLALMGGVAVIVICMIGRRARWVVAGACAVAISLGGAWLYHTSHLDVTMARGAATRFRLYAWRYAAELWQSRPMAGMGAGSFPRLAGQLAAADRTLDPAAFMDAALVDHAHNELFEVLTEIGLVGGVTFVAGVLATFLAAAAISWRGPAAPERWLLVGVASSVAAMLGDSLVGVTLRLPGGPGVFFTLLGILWGTCRTDARADDSTEPVVSAASGPPRGARTALMAAICLAAALSAGWLALRNWMGLVHEQSGYAALERGVYAEALDHTLAAEPLLLDPVRRIIADQAAVHSRLVLAQQAWSVWRSTASSKPSVAVWEHAVRRATEAYWAAMDLRRDVPALAHSDAIAARAARFLAELYAAKREQEAAQWVHEAELAWRRQRLRTPLDVETLLNLTEYPDSLANHVGLLRDALRFLDTLPFAERRPDDPSAPPRLWLIWRDRLARVAQHPAFEQTLVEFLEAVGPITPQTDLDSLVASMAPETYRLMAAWQGSRGDWGAAAVASIRAAELYRPMRVRFPELYSVALAEEADYLLRGSGGAAPSHEPASAGRRGESPSPEGGVPASAETDIARAMALLREAIAALPQIQEQKYEEMVRPFRDQLVLCLLAAGRMDDAIDTLRQTLETPDADEAGVERGLQSLIRDALKVGEPIELLRRIVGELCPRFPSFCGSASRPAGKGDDQEP